MSRISGYQLFVLTLSFQIGTTIIFGFASSAGRDCWIASLLSAGVGVLLILMYIAIYRLNPGLTLIEWFPAQFGKILGTPIAWVYPMLNLYECGRLIGDIKDMLPPVILPKTPELLICLIFMCVIAYAAISGLEVVFRLAEILFPMILVFFISEIVLIAGSGIIDADHLLPIAGKGWGRIMKAVWPLGITQTYGETIYFAMAWPYVKQQNKIIKATMLATVFSTLVITTLDLLAVSVLGETNFAVSLYPLFKLVQQIRVADFIENLDAVAVLFLLTTAFFKGVFKIVCVCIAMQKLLITKNHQLFVIPASLISLYLGMTMASSVQDHIEAGLKILPNNLWLPAFIVIPFILLIVSLIRWKLQSAKKKKRSFANG